jgi:beta-N-acetylhexosaminidase
MVLVCNKPESVVQVIDGLKIDDNPFRHLRLIRLRGRHTQGRDTLLASNDWQTAVKVVSSYGPESEREFNLV